MTGLTPDASVGVTAKEQNEKMKHLKCIGVRRRSLRQLIETVYPQTLGQSPSFCFGNFRFRFNVTRSPFIYLLILDFHVRVGHVSHR